MPLYVVFSTASPHDPPPDPMAIQAVLTRADTEQAAVEQVILRNMLTIGHNGELHVDDLATSSTFVASFDVTVERKGPGEGVDAPPGPGDSEPAPSPPPEVQHLPAEPVDPDAPDMTPQQEPPAAAFTYAPDPPQRNDEVQFDASSSTAGSAPITRYDWAFGDDSAPDAGPEPTYQFTRRGDFDVVLTVTDDGGLTAEATQTISI